MVLNVKNGDFDLSIVTVCYNAKERLWDTVQSVLAIKSTTQLKVQHLLVDGASTDGSVELLQEWRCGGMIEDYVSEPDAGIYDAMNKGIRMARGTVLYFLNAGDILLNTRSLEVCVTRLLSGETQHAAAPVLRSLDGKLEKDFPCFEYVYLRTPCCHQGYFAVTELYRSLGGYDVSSYRCLADADFMCRAFAVAGKPFVENKAVALYPDDGFSSNCVFHYLPEYVEMTQRNWDAVMRRCKVDAEYRDMVMGVLTDRCMELAKWKLEKKRDVADLVGKLQQQLRSLAGMCWHPIRWVGLNWAANGYLPRVQAPSSISPCWEKVMYWVRIVCSMRPGNKYAMAGGYPVRSLNAALVAKFHSLFRR